jgi:hypothetical protein
MDQNNPDYVEVNPRSAIVKDYPNNSSSHIRMWNSEWVTDWFEEGHYVHYSTRDFDVMVSAIFWGDDRYIDLVFPEGPNIDDGREHLSNPYRLNYTF